MRMVGAYWRTHRPSQLAWFEGWHCLHSLNEPEELPQLPRHDDSTIYIATGIIICPIAIAYSIGHQGHIINSVFLCHSVSVSLSAVSTLTVAFLDRFSPNVAQRQQPPKVRTSTLRVNITPSLPLFCSQNRHFGLKDPENPCKHKSANLCLKCLRIIRILASHTKLGSRNTMVTSDFRLEVEIRHLWTCAQKNMQYNACVSFNEGKQQSCLM